MASGLKKSPAKFIMAAAGLASGAVNLIGGIAAKKRAAREQRKAQRELNKQKKAYERLDTSNIYKDVTSQFAGMETQFENVYEDMTVNQQQAEFQAQQQAQQRADIMQNLRGAAGGSGVAALAQQMASQQALGTQQISADIGQQEAAQQQLRAQGAAEARQLGLSQERLIAEGETAAETQRLAGAETARGLEYKKGEAFMGLAAGQLAAAKQAKAAASAQISSGIGSMIGGVAGGLTQGLGNLATEGGTFWKAGK